MHDDGNIAHSKRCEIYFAESSESVTKAVLMAETEVL